MELSLNVVFLTTDDPLYLPAFFDRVLQAWPGTTAVLIVPPLYKNQTTVAAARRYLRTFGFGATCRLALETARAKFARRSVAHTCHRHGTRCADVQDVNSPDVLQLLRDLETDLVVSVSCPQLFKSPLINLPRLGCLNVHGSILPEYRGVLPSFWMLANSEPRAGVSVFFVNEEIDAGDLCGQRTFEIHKPDTMDRLLRKSKSVAADLVLDVLEKIQSGTVTRTPLDVTKGTYYSWPDRAAVKRFRGAGHRLW